ncbi:hypothetical protein AAMO2058_001662800 [Amorphochlora amoebiformis]
MSQEAYAKRILIEYKMQNCKGVTTPMAPSVKLTKDEEGPGVDQEKYRSIIGKIASSDTLHYLIRSPLLPSADSPFESLGPRFALARAIEIDPSELLKRHVSATAAQFISAYSRLPPSSLSTNRLSPLIPWACEEGEDDEKDAKESEKRGNFENFQNFQNFQNFENSNNLNGEGRCMIEDAKRLIRDRIGRPTKRRKKNKNYKSGGGGIFGQAGVMATNWVVYVEKISELISYIKESPPISMSSSPNNFGVWSRFLGENPTSGTISLQPEVDVKRLKMGLITRHRLLEAYKMDPHPSLLVSLTHLSHWLHAVCEGSGLSLTCLYPISLRGVVTVFSRTKRGTLGRLEAILGFIDNDIPNEVWYEFLMQLQTQAYILQAFQYWGEIACLGESGPSMRQLETWKAIFQSFTD